MASSSSSSDEKMILLISSDKQHFELPEAAANLSKTVGYMIEDGCTDNGIPLANVTAKVLTKVVEYCKRHAPISSDATEESAAAKAKEEDEELREFDAKFVAVGNVMLFDLILAANFLNIPCLLNLACDRAAKMITKMTVEEVRLFFQIKNDFTPEEEEEIRRDNAWAFE